MKQGVSSSRPPIKARKLRRSEYWQRRFRKPTRFIRTDRHVDIELSTQIANACLPLSITITFDFVCIVCRLSAKQAEREEGRETEDNGRIIGPQSDRCAHRTGSPQTGRSGCSPHTALQHQNGTAPDEPHAGDKSLYDPSCRLRTAACDPFRCLDEPAGGDCHQGERPKPSTALALLAVPANGQCQQICDNHGADMRQHIKRGSDCGDLFNQIDV